jgi:hypothetical protein
VGYVENRLKLRMSSKLCVENIRRVDDFSCIWDARRCKGGLNDNYSHY